MWLQLIDFLDAWPWKEERQMALDYTRSHLEQSWPHRWRQGFHLWEQSSLGWEFMDRADQRISSLPQAREVWCPPGSFQVHRRPSDSSSTEDEPMLTVQQPRGLWAMTTPVTEEMWHSVPLPPNLRSFIHNEGRDAHQDQCPITALTWLQMVVFCNEVSRREGLEEAYEIVWPEVLPQAHQQELWHTETNVFFAGTESSGYRLPTELEWEVLARAGCVKDHYEEPSDTSWHSENSGGHIHPVGLKKPNAWGLFDTVGNVYERCTDTSPDESMFPDWTAQQSTSTVRCQSSDLFVAERGGSYGCDQHMCNLWARDYVLRYTSDRYTGFRMVRTCTKD